MKIAIHSNQFDGRGSGKVPYDYGVGLKNNFDYEVVFITSSLSANLGLKHLQTRFRVILYDKKLMDLRQNLEIRDVLSRIVDSEKIDFLHMIKFGINDYITPENCRTGIHCVFQMTQPHGTVYAGVSEYLANRFALKSFVPHIIRNYPPTKNLRAELGIPDDAFVLGRHGGDNTFDLPYAHRAIEEILKQRKDIFFLFLSTDRFYEHERILYLPWVESEQEKFNFIHACDAMLHARTNGETFGISVGEFSAANKPIITWTGNNIPGYDTAHIEMLGGRAILYDDAPELVEILANIDKPYVRSSGWDMFSNRFCEKNVMMKYKEVFL